MQEPTGGFSQGGPTQNNPQNYMPAANEPIPVTGYGSIGGASTTGVRVLRHINVGSAFKIGAICTGLIMAILGVFLVVPMMMGLGAMSAFGGRNGAAGAGIGVLGASMMYVIMIVFYTIFGGIMSALYAWIYNMAAGWVGGLEVEVS